MNNFHNRSTTKANRTKNLSLIYNHHFIKTDKKVIYALEIWRGCAWWDDAGEWGRDCDWAWSCCSRRAACRRGVAGRSADSVRLAAAVAAVAPDAALAADADDGAAGRGRRRRWSRSASYYRRGSAVRDSSGSPAPAWSGISAPAARDSNYTLAHLPSTSLRGPRQKKTF